MITHRITYSADMVKTAINRMARAISNDFSGQDITLVGVLNGGVFLVTHLATALEEIGLVAHCQLDFLRVSSYRDGRISGKLELTSGLQAPVTGKNIIIVDDVGDTLNTLSLIQKLLAADKPCSLKIAVLLEKPDKHVRTDVVLDYIGISEPGLGFLYGCGMDLNGAYRGLPFIAMVTD